MAEFGAKSCSKPGCRTHDFLPYTCPACNGIFCSEHYSISAHVCENGQEYLASRGDEGEAISEAGAHGSHHPLSSSKPSEVMAAVTSRFDGREGELNVGVSHYNIKASATGHMKSCSGAPDRRLTDAHIAVDKASSEKGKRVSSQVLKMLIKSKAVGDKRLRMEDRFFLQVHYWGNDQDVHYLYFSRLWTVGRVLDEILKTRRRFLRVEPDVRDLSLELANAESPGGLAVGSILNDLAPQLQSFDAVTVRPRTSIDSAVAGNDSAAVGSGSGSKIELEARSIDKSGGFGVEVQSGRLLPQANSGSTGDATEMREAGCSDGRDAQSCVSDPTNAAVLRSSVEKGLTITVGHGRNVHRLSGICPEKTRVLDVKRRLEPLTGVPFVRQKLVFKGILRDGDLVRDTKIFDESQSPRVWRPAVLKMERTPAIEQLIALARRISEAVGLRPRADVTLEEIEPLIQLMSMFTPELLGLVPQAAHAYIVPVTMRPLDIRYLHIAQEEGFSIGVFVLPPGACIPLHNHPNMFVISRVLYGSVKITSYDHHQGEPGNSSRVRGSQPQGRGGATAGTAAAGTAAAAAAAAGGGGGGGHPPLLATLRASSWYGAPHTSALSPSVANFHEIEAGEDGTAILDVLLPPYDEDSGRDCTYYRPEQTSGPWVRLEPCYPGDHFRVVRGNYVSPYSI